ncbi:hypothetical protein FIU87_11915 [Bacillus sp. THAF10]|nr:hypothetical protein FIU87_11915 [Bacillus sp. THAF10]
MFRRMYSRPRHLSYNRNLSLLSQLPFLNNIFSNGGNGMQGMFSPNGMGANVPNQQMMFPQGMMPNMMNQMGFPQQNMNTQGFPFNTMNTNWQNPSQSMGMGMMQPNQYPQGTPGNGMMQPNQYPQGTPGNGMMQPNQYLQGTSGNGMMQQNGMQNGWMQPNQMPFMNPYPSQAQPPKTQTSQVNSFMNQFKGQDGNVDMKKMMDTAGQMMNTVNQINNMFKGLASTFKV